MFEGVTHSCRERVQWLVGEGGSTVVAALETVSQECSEQCMCSPADFGVQEDLSTTAMLVSSPEPPHHGSTTLPSAEQTTSTTATERNASEPVQGDGDLSTMPEGHYDELAGVIEEVDKDGDGLLTYDELLAGMLLEFEAEGEEIEDIDG